jgi:hypothetical protein
VAASRGRAFAAGFAWTGQARDFVVRAVDERTGALLWQDQVDKGDDDFASGVVADGGRVFVSGNTYKADTGYDWLLRAYDEATGALLWEKRYDLVGRSDFSRGTALAAGGGLVFLGGYGTNAQDTGDFNTDWVVRAYDARTGRLRWHDRIGGFSGAYSLAYDRGRLIAGGWTASETEDLALVRAYDARNGWRLWEDTTPGARGTGGTWTKVVRADGGRVFAAQPVQLAETFRQAPRVKAFDAVSGALLWEDRLETGERQWLQDLAVADGRVSAVGYGGAGCVSGVRSNCDAVIRTYGAHRGSLLWERSIDLSGLDDAAELVVADRDVVFVNSTAGPLTTLPGCCTIGQWVVHAFDGSDGRLLWQGLGEEGDSAIYNMAHAGGRLFIPGRAVDLGSSEWDWILRAYDVRGRRGAVVQPLRRQVSGTGTAGEAAYDVTFAGPVTTAAHGLVPAEETRAAVADDPADDLYTALDTGIGVTLHTLEVPPGARYLRLALVDVGTGGQDDLDLYAFGPEGLFLSSAGGASDERIDLAAPPPGVYQVAVHGYDTDGPDAAYTLLSFALGNEAAGNLHVSGPGSAGSGRVTVTWSGLAAGARYLGAVSYTDGSGERGQTLVDIHAVP